MKKTIKYVKIAGVIIFLYLLIFPLSIKIDRTVEAVEIALDDKGYLEPVNVIITGKYNWKMLGKDTFNGNIKFDKFQLTMKEKLKQGKDLPTLTFDKERTAYLEYGQWMDSTFFGFISTKAFLNKFVVQVAIPDGAMGGGWSEIDGKCIVAPATNREDALGVLRKFSNRLLPPYEHWIE